MSARDRQNLDLFAEETYTVSSLGRELAGLLREAYPSVWIAGEIQRFRVHGSGHCYFELVEKGDGDDVVGKLDAAIWRSDAARIRASLAHHGQRLTDGLAIRLRATIDFYPPHGKLQIHVKEVDPAFALGQLEARRRETLAELEAAGLLDANRRVPLPDLPLAIGLITSQGSAAYHDFLSTLEESGYGFRVLLVHSAVMGRDAERGVASALELLAASGVDCIALVRGGGAKSDLAAFDSRTIAFAVARSPCPSSAGSVTRSTSRWRTGWRIAPSRPRPRRRSSWSSAWPRPSRAPQSSRRGSRGRGAGRSPARPRRSRARSGGSSPRVRASPPWARASTPRRVGSRRRRRGRCERRANGSAGRACASASRRRARSPMPGARARRSPGGWSRRRADGSRRCRHISRASDAWSPSSRRSGRCAGASASRAPPRDGPYATRRRSRRERD